MDEIILYTIVFMFGIIIGSFVNVCIYRIPNEESVILNRSYCYECNKPIHWYDMIPILSYIILKGKCRNCKSYISIQYPIIEALNGLLYILAFMIKGWNITTVLCCFVISALIVISVIDFKTYTINIWVNIFILFIGIIKLFIEITKTNDFSLILKYLGGFCIISSLLLILYIITSGKGIGMGDISLTAAAGFFLGWQLNILAFLLGCIFGAVIHMAMIKFRNHSHVLAFGPYLSLGILISMLFGKKILIWYLYHFF